MKSRLYWVKEPGRSLEGIGRGLSDLGAQARRLLLGLRVGRALARLEGPWIPPPGPRAMAARLSGLEATSRGQGLHPFRSGGVAGGRALRGDLAREEGRARARLGAGGGPPGRGGGKRGSAPSTRPKTGGNNTVDRSSRGWTR